MSLAPLILTCSLDATSFERLDGLRRAHFPSERNVLSAHLTLFHHLPGEAEAAIMADLHAAARRPPLAMQVIGLRFLGRGVAYEVRSAALSALRAELLGKWEADHPDAITAQDRQGFRPHVTVQNKADPADARALLDTLSADFEPWAATGEALRLWRYLGGPWEAAGEAPFTR